MDKFKVDLLDFSADLVEMADRLCEKRTFPAVIADEMLELLSALHIHIAATMALVDVVIGVLARRDHG